MRRIAHYRRRLLFVLQCLLDLLQIDDCSKFCHTRMDDHASAMMQKHFARDERPPADASGATQIKKAAEAAFSCILTDSMLVAGVDPLIYIMMQLVIRLLIDVHHVSALVVLE